jgi:hypothetical protein
MQHKIMPPLEVQYGTYQQEIIMVLDYCEISGGSLITVHYTEIMSAQCRN